MSTVRVTNPCVVVLGGLPTPLRLDEPFDSDDEVVRQFPHAFAIDNVEAATANPGERRNVRR
jgi:hypothetical protein